MRSFEQRIAEISRRSEKILKERRKRRSHLLIACIPLVLCIGLGSVLALPEMLYTKTADGNAWAAGELGDEKTGSLACSVVKVQVSGESVFQTYTENAHILQIFDRLRSYGIRYVENSSTAERETEAQEEQKREMEDSDSTADSITGGTVPGYTITLTMHDGTTAEYYLVGARLEDRTAQQTYCLTEQELFALLELLGIERG